MASSGSFQHVTGHLQPWPIRGNKSSGQRHLDLHDGDGRHHLHSSCCAATDDGAQETAAAATTLLPGFLSRGIPKPRWIRPEGGGERGDEPAASPNRTPARDRSRSPRRHASQPESGRRFRIDQPVDYLYWLTLHVQLANGLGSVEQQQQFQAMDNSLRSQLANDSGPLGTAATQSLPVLLYTLSPMFATWQLRDQQ